MAMVSMPVPQAGAALPSAKSLRLVAATASSGPGQRAATTSRGCAAPARQPLFASALTVPARCDNISLPVEAILPKMHENKPSRADLMIAALIALSLLSLLAPVGRPRAVSETPWLVEFISTIALAGVF